MRSTIARNPAELSGIIAHFGPEVISVDLFDTLVYRSCRDPKTVFELQHERIHQILPTQPCRSWVKLRMQVELDLSRAAHPHEVHISDIYREIARRMRLTEEEAAQLLHEELETERLVILAYQPVVALLQEAHTRGTVICVTTDTYLPEAFIRSLLKGFLTFPFALLCSSETLHPKRSGLAFKKLRELYPTVSLLHIGDNPYSDIERARGYDIDTCLVSWGRERFLARNREIVDFLAQMNIRRFETPVESFIMGDVAAARHELAWRWATVLAQFAIRIEAYTYQTKADEVWFLSRDCETLFAAIAGNHQLFRGICTRYVHTSRAAAYPIVAVDAPELFIKWQHRDPTAADIASGVLLKQRYRDLRVESSRRILIVDNGWKGRLQMALQLGLRETEIFGFYFSLDNLAEGSSIEKSNVFLDWNPCTINQAAVEALAGFKEPTCTGYVLRDNRFQATFSESATDISPTNYCEPLYKYVVNILENDSLKAVEHSSIAEIVKRTTAFPDTIVAQAFKDWCIAAEIDGTTKGALLVGGGTDRLSRLLGRMNGGNLWPSLAVWSLVTNRRLATLLQWTIYIRRFLTYMVRQMVEVLLGRLRGTNVGPALQPDPEKY